MIEKKNEVYFFLIILIFIVVPIVYFSYINFVSWQNFRFYFDDAYYQKLYLSFLDTFKHSKNFYYSAYGSKHIFFDHLYFTSLIYLPVYYLFPYPLTLRILQNIIVFSGGIFYVLLLIKKYNNKSIFTAAAILSIFALHPTIQGALITTTHTSSFIQLLAPALFYFYFTNQKKLYLLSALLILLTREDMAFIIIGWSAITFFIYKDKKISVFLGLSAIIYLLTAMFIIQPALLSSGNSQHLLINKYYYQFGNSYAEILKNLIFRFDIVIKHFTSKSALFVYFILFGSFFFIPLYKAYFLLPVFPLLCLNILSVFPGMQDPKNYYFAPVIPYVMLAFIDTVCGMSTKMKKFFLILALILSLCLSWRWGYSPFSANTNRISTGTRQNNIDNIFYIKAKVKNKNSSIAASEFLANYFIENTNLYVFDKDIEFSKFSDKIDYIICFDYQIRIYFNDYLKIFTIIERRGGICLLKKIEL